MVVLIMDRRPALAAESLDVAVYIPFPGQQQALFAGRPSLENNSMISISRPLCRDRRTGKMCPKGTVVPIWHENEESRFCQQRRGVADSVVRWQHSFAGSPLKEPLRPRHGRGG